ncbi:MAG: mannose-1-phosphate guanylyltransferase/mannose-6-phosphate isomerase [Treponema sp. CETP13]|nr:MAG: mannose-1-phosphate guanylyltransferase/mannose-6-phosphate isomerase [Treponema sp. CETP13]
MMYSIILSGGSGTRLWPLSRRLQPKQLLSLIGTGTMIQQTVQRLCPLENEVLESEYQKLYMQSPIIVCNKKHRFTIAEQMQQIKVNPIIMLEPVARNTAPAVAAACMQAQKLSGSDSALVFVLPSDHIINNISSFHATIVKAVKMAKLGRLVTFGITASSPQTAYGYIKADITEANKDSYTLQEFTEKPDLETAKEYIADGSYFWNSGMFVFRADIFLHELKKFEPQLYMHTKQSFTKALNESDFIVLDEDSFSKNRALSIDCAVMEHTTLGTVVPLQVGWSDVGSWDSLWNASDKDLSGNHTQGTTLISKTQNCYIHNNVSTKKIITTIGIQDLVIIDTDDALLVAHKKSSQSIKELVKKLKKHKRDDLL